MFSARGGVHLMRVDVLLGECLPTPSEVAGRIVVVIDVLRASTVIVQALSSGARAVVPMAEVDEAVNAAQQYGRNEVRLAGERRAMPIAGFDAGNSPLQMTESLVHGRILLMTTTNGTAALLSCHGARRVYVGAFVNLSETVRAVLRESREGSDVLLVCAGQDRRFALEDAACAGVFVSEIARARRGTVLSDAANVARQLGRRYASKTDRLAHDAAHARTLASAGFSSDVSFCLKRDLVPLIATYTDRQVSRERILSAA